MTPEGATRLFIFVLAIGGSYLTFTFVYIWERVFGIFAVGGCVVALYAYTSSFSLSESIILILLYISGIILGPSFYYGVEDRRHLQTVISFLLIIAGVVFLVMKGG